MKIAYMAYDRPKYIGGPIINALRILPEFVKRGHQVLAIIGYTDDYPNARILEANGVYVRVYKQTYSEKNVKQILFYLKEFEPDIFVPNISAQGGYAGYWIKKAGIPTIIAHRGDCVRNWCTARTFGIKKWKWQTSGIICVSEYLKKKCLEITEDNLNINVIPSGVPIPKFKAKQQSHKIKVVFTGRLVQNPKRIWETLDAFIYLANSFDDLEFTLIGDGPEKQSLIEYIKKNNVSDKIFIKNEVYGDDYVKELVKHNVIILLSDFEGMPGSIMDGMAAGLVPVCYNFNGIHELVIHNKTGIIVNDRKEEFYNAIINLKNDTLLRNKLANEARNYIINKYSLDIAVDKWESFFCELLSKSGNKTTIKAPFFIHLPPKPICYKNLYEDIRFFEYYFKKLKNKLRIRSRLKAILNGQLYKTSIY